MQLKPSTVRRVISEAVGRVLKAEKGPEVRHKSARDRIVPVQVSSKLSRLVRRDYLRCDPESIVHLDWSSVGGEIE